MDGSAPRVLLGDSAASELPGNILDILEELCICARDISIAHVETGILVDQVDQVESSFATLAEALSRFGRRAEQGVLDARAEEEHEAVLSHGREAAAALSAQVAAWLSCHEAERDQRVAALRDQIRALQEQMVASLDRFVLPLRAQSGRRVLRRELAEGRYTDVATVEMLPGFRAEFDLDDVGPAQPCRLRSLLGKGQKLQVGTKRGLLRRVEEPAYVALDDLLIQSAEIGPDSARLELVKKPGGNVALTIVLSAVGDEVRGRAQTAAKVAQTLTEEDRATARLLWSALQEESSRIIAAPARRRGYWCGGELVQTPDTFIDAVALFIEHYRPIVRTIMAHGPNLEELTIKVEHGDRREERWVRRETLAGHLAQVPVIFAERLGMDALGSREAMMEPTVGREAALDDGGDAPVAPLENTATAVYVAVPKVSVIVDDTHDISLTDIEIEPEEDEEVRPTAEVARPLRAAELSLPPPPAVLQRKPSA